MAKIKAFTPGSVAKVLGVMYAVLGLIFGIVMFFVSLVAAAKSESTFGLVFGIMLLVALPLGYGLLGFVFGYISSWFYNAIAKRVGGIEVEVE